MTVCEANHDGALPPVKKGFEGAGLNLDAVKPAEDGSGFVVRVSERNGSAGKHEAEIFGSRFCIDAKAYEIVTMKHSGAFFRTDMREKTE